jgi:hypothetical protein
LNAAAPGLRRCLLAAACLVAATFAVTPEARADTQASRVWYQAGAYPELALPGGRRETIRSMLDVTRSMRFGDFVWDEKRIPKGTVWIRVDLPRQIVSVFRAGHEIGTAVILYGTDGKPTPTGNFTVLEKKADYYSHSYQAPMPYMLRLTSDGVAIHGSNVFRGRATHGCIGVPLDFARLLFDAASKGDMVAIVPAQAKTNPTATKKNSSR